MDKSFVSPLEAYAVACTLPVDEPHMLVVKVTSVAAPAGTWNYVYPSCIARSLPFLIAMAKNWDTFICFYRRTPQRMHENYRGAGPFPCAICGMGHMNHD